MARLRCAVVTSSGGDAEDLRGGGAVDVAPLGERGDEPGVLGQVGDHAQLDLVVVGHQQPAPVGGDEGPAQPPALLGAHGDVVQVGPVRRQPPGARHGLVEGGVDAAVGGHLGQQPLAVGGAQLLHLAVAQQGVDDRVLVRAASRASAASVENPVLVLRPGVSPSRS